MNECICRHFYSPTYNREILTRTDHMNLLATPKGYRWYGPGGEIQIKSRAFRGRSIRKKEKEKEEPEIEAFPGMAQFMNEVWTLITPDILLSLREILMDEFGMSERSAVLFLMKQYIKTQREADRECYPCSSPTEEQLEWARNIARTIASKAISYTEMMTTTNRNKRTAMIFDAVMERLQKALGIQPNSDSPLNKLLLRVVDGMAVWLSSIPGENNFQNICSDLMTVYFNVPLQ
ncbi:unnamed protein product [Nezara viridula]|uniref:Uncharacterized protein n=1 Tax=Nezara viridula TaxID=85310 RepID=A0A9P0HJS7_NEZVI|nr:unnamed protein product [Nezara viridula]